jgi:GT2 family glycosyltransferase
MPVVSVLMVFHRDTPFLRPAIASVLAQTFRDFELLLVDNGTGLTAADLGPAGADERLRWVRLEKNLGIAAGHNAGVAAARGEFIALLDYDDLALPARLEKQVAALRADPGLGLVSSRAQRIDAADRVTGPVFTLADPAGHRAYARYAAPIITPAVAGRREVFVAVPYRAEFPFAADLDFQARASEHWRFAVLPEVLLHYRWYADQTTQQKLGMIERSRAVICLTSARRRAGRPENLAAALAETETLDPAAGSRRLAGLCVNEGFFEEAAFLARRSLALERSPWAAFAAMRLAARAWCRAAPAERGGVSRMFFQGPVRALGLTPA